jgi:pimeloyl-ACP methyl ester carboxylesterase
LVAAGYRVIAPDQPGFGLTEAPSETKAYAIENHVADLAALLAKLGLKKVLLIGHDWGRRVLAVLHEGQRNLTLRSSPKRSSCRKLDNFRGTLVAPAGTIFSKVFAKSA